MNERHEFPIVLLDTDTVVDAIRSLLLELHLQEMIYISNSRDGITVMERIKNALNSVNIDTEKLLYEVNDNE